MAIFEDIFQHLRNFELAPFLPKAFQETSKASPNKTYVAPREDLPGFENFYVFFLEAYPLNPLTHAPLAELNEYLYYHTMLSDALIDKDAPAQVDTIFSLSICQNQYLRLMHQLVDPNCSAFWVLYECFQKEFINACTKEQREHFGQVSDYPSCDFELIAAGKTAHAKIIPSLMACMNPGNPSGKLDIILESIDYFFIGLQCRDDLRDWRSDLKEGRYSKLLSEVLQGYFREPYENLDLSVAGKLIYWYKGEDTLDEAISYYQKAYNLVKPIPSLSLWRQAIEKSMQECRAQKEQLKKLLVSA